METTKNRVRWFLLIDWFVLMPLLVRRPLLAVLGATGLALLARQERGGYHLPLSGQKTIPQG